MDMAAYGRQQSGRNNKALFEQLQCLLLGLLTTLSSAAGCESLQRETLRLLGSLVTHVPGALADAALQQHMLAQVWRLLIINATLYQSQLTQEDDAEEEAADSDGERLGLQPVLYELLDFVQKLSEAKRFRSLVEDALPDLLFYLVLFLQISRRQETEWAACPNK